MLSAHVRLDAARRVSAAPVESTRVKYSLHDFIFRCPDHPDTKQHVGITLGYLGKIMMIVSLRTR